MKLLFKNKKTSVYLKNNGRILKTGSIGKNEITNQTKAYSLGIAPFIYDSGVNYIEMEYIEGLILEECSKNMTLTDNLL